MYTRLKRAVRENPNVQSIQEKTNASKLGTVSFQYKKRVTPTNWEHYRYQRNQTVTIRRNAIKAYFNDKCAEGANNTDVWPTINPFLTKRNRGKRAPLWYESMIKSSPEHCLENRWRRRREPNIRVLHWLYH